MKTDIKYPVAKDKFTNNLVSVKNVENGIGCNCICFECNEDLIAVNKEIKQKAHFRHVPNSECKANFESYIHWLAKEIFKEITEINLPEISEDYIWKTIENDIIKLHELHKSPRQLEEKIKRYVIDRIKNKFRNVKVEKVEIEKFYKTNLGDVRIDIVLVFSNKDEEVKRLFIEPFFSNPVDTNKVLKLKELDISTFSIDLFSFINKKGHYYTKEEFKSFLINGMNAKEWVYLKKNKLLTKNEFIEIEEKIKQNSKLFKKELYNYIETKNRIAPEIEIHKKDIAILHEIIKNKEKEIKNKLNSIDELDLL